MNITFYFKNLEATDAIKKYTSEKLEKLKERLHHIEGVDVRFSLERQNQIFEVTVHADAKVFYLRKIEKDLYAAIDNALLALNNQIDRYRKKIDENSSVMPADLVPEEDFAGSDRQTVPVFDAMAKPMDDYEAVLQMKANKYRFFMYHKASTERYSVVLEKNDGTCSIIAPADEPKSYEETIVRVKDHGLDKVSASLYSMPKLTVGEAIEKLFEEDKDYLVFFNVETVRLYVLFRDRRGRLALQKPVK